MAEGPFLVKSIDNNTAVITREDDSAERVSRSRITLAPKPLTTKELDRIFENVTVDRDFPSKGGGDDAEAHQFNSTPSRDGANEPEASSKSQEKAASSSPSVVVDTEEFVIDKVVDHKLNKNRRHKFANVGEPLFLVRWYGYEPDQDTWKPVRHLPHSKIIQYFKRADIHKLANIDHAIDG